MCLFVCPSIHLFIGQSDTAQLRLGLEPTVLTEIIHSVSGLSEAQILYGSAHGEQSELESVIFWELLERLVQLILEQQACQLCGSTYMWISFSIANTAVLNEPSLVESVDVESQLWRNCRCRGTTYREGRL